MMTRLKYWSFIKLLWHYLEVKGNSYELWLECAFLCLSLFDEAVEESKGALEGSYFMQNTSFSLGIQKE
jgi:hypothetical protein